MENQNQQIQTPQTPNQMPSPVNTPNGLKIIPILLGIAAVTVIAIGAYLLGTKQNQTVVQNQQTSAIPTAIPTPSLLPTKSQLTLVQLKTPGIFTNEEIGYTVEFPKDWNVYYSINGDGKSFMLLHPKCKEDFVLPKDDALCTRILLPYYQGATGWAEGVGPEKVITEKITLKNNIKANKLTINYDSYIRVVWTFYVDIPKEFEVQTSLIALATANENLMPDSLETLDKIINSITFNK